ncbi:neurogenic protein big brain-like [Copidosoma floridanum]|uniref:neurogenic protein big brain-like n=1 Tax=Copidosoma floridanum TaxID=29053 RepID=UPI000C6FA7F0|nr:neurogenic protein big brain-like [Copidosoma floridanum]
MTTAGAIGGGKQQHQRDLDAHIVTLLTKLSALKENGSVGGQSQQPQDARHHHEHTAGLPPMSTEAWSLEFWRAVAVECFATFLFAFVVAGSAVAPATSNSGLNALTTAVATGFAIAAVQLIFGPVSGGHVNPAVTVSFALSRKVSAFRAIAYGLAQCGGGVAGAAMLYGVANAPQNLISTSSRLSDQAPLKFLVELTLSSFIILAHYCAESPRSLSSTVSGKPACVLAAAYTAATLVSTPFLNPARALGIAFVTYRWDNHWVQWMGPIIGSMVAALINEYVLSGSRHLRESRDYDDGDNSSMRSDEETYDDLPNRKHGKYSSAGYQTYRPVASGASIYGPPPALERVESIYGGTKSLYCKSPPLTRANLNRSQSVYAKSTSTGVRDGLIIPKPGPLQPAQSLYPIRLNAVGHESHDLRPIHPVNQQQQHLQTQPTPPAPQQQNHNSTNQNMQNQLQQCTQNIYGIRGITSTSGLGQRDNIYGHLVGGGGGGGAISQQQRDSPSSIYGRAPAPPPTTHCTPPLQQHQQQPPPPPPPPLQQQLPTRDNGHSPHQGSQDGGNSSTGGSMRRGPTVDLRPESMYGHTQQQRRTGDDSAYGTYQSSSRGSGGAGATYGKLGGPPPPPHGYSHQQQGRANGGPPQPGYQRHSPNPPPPQY